MKRSRPLCRLVCLAAALCLLLTGCSKPAEPTPAPEETDDSLLVYQSPVVHMTGTAYDDLPYGFQLDAPESGEEIAVLHTNFGDIAIRLFPDGAPKAVENFKALIRSGYYDGLSFHRILNDFMIQSGDPNGDGSGGESSFGGKFADEFDQKLLNLRGALSMANPGLENQNGSQFFINQCKTNAYSEATCEAAAASYQENYENAAGSYKEYYDYYLESLAEHYDSWEEFFRSNYYLAPMPGVVPQEVWDLYNRQGGNIHLDGAWRNYGGHTVFGQVFDGMDVVDAIAAVEVNGEDGAPLYQVLVQKAELISYDAATYRGSGVLSPELIPVETDKDENKTPEPVYPLTDAQLSTAHTVTDVYADRAYGFQLEAPAIGEEIAVLHTSSGDIRIRLFPEAAPKAVENFRSLIQNGFYDNLTFHYAVKDFIVQSGDPSGDGTGGVSSTGHYLPDEFDKKLLNLRGAVSMGNTGVQNTATSQFFINQTTPASETATKAYWTQTEEAYNSSYSSTVSQFTSDYVQNEESLSVYYGSKDIYLAANTTLAPHVKWVPNAVWDLYQKYGGNIHLDGQWREYGGNTVFGQVFDGMDAVDAIAAAEVDDNNRPIASITILSAEITTYTGK